jgi:hypothetical protein
MAGITGLVVINVPSDTLVFLVHLRLGMGMTINTVEFIIAG